MPTAQPSDPWWFVLALVVINVLPQAVKAAHFAWWERRALLRWQSTGEDLGIAYPGLPWRLKAGCTLWNVLVPFVLAAIPGLVPGYDLVSRLLMASSAAAASLVGHNLANNLRSRA